jgi:hypothetical protein
MYRHVETDMPYPKSPKQKCDWRWTTPSNEVFMIETRMMRLMGDNGKANDNILTRHHGLPGHRDACRGVDRVAMTRKSRIMIYGPKNDGSYLVEFRIADGEALVISVPAGETRVLKYFQKRMPTGFSCRGSTQKSCAGRELVGAAQEIPWGPITALEFSLRTSTESVARGAAKAGVETANRFDLGS